MGAKVYKAEITTLFNTMVLGKLITTCLTIKLDFSHTIYINELNMD